MATHPMTITLGDLRIGRIGYGAMRLTGPDLWGDYPDRPAGIALLRQARRAPPSSTRLTCTGRTATSC
jgi:hypothetical protein